MKTTAILLCFIGLGMAVSAQDIKQDPPKQCNKVSAEVGPVKGSVEKCTTKNKDGSTTTETTKCVGVSVGVPKGNVSAEHCTTKTTTTPSKQNTSGNSQNSGGSSSTTGENKPKKK